MRRRPLTWTLKIPFRAMMSFNTFGCLIIEWALEFVTFLRFSRDDPPATLIESQHT